MCVHLRMTPELLRRLCTTSVVRERAGVETTQPEVATCTSSQVPLANDVCATLVAFLPFGPTARRRPSAGQAGVASDARWLHTQAGSDTDCLSPVSPCGEGSRRRVGRSHDSLSSSPCRSACDAVPSLWRCERRAVFARRGVMALDPEKVLRLRYATLPIPVPPTSVAEGASVRPCVGTLVAEREPDATRGDFEPFRSTARQAAHGVAGGYPVRLLPKAVGQHYVLHGCCLVPCFVQYGEPGLMPRGIAHTSYSFGRMAVTRYAGRSL